MLPTPKIRQICKFCLGVAAERNNILLHALQFLANHFHLVATDPEGRLPDFMHWLDMFLAKCINAELERWEYLWSPGSYNSVELADGDAILDAMEYTYVNVVRARLVRNIKEWPGALSFPKDLDNEGEWIERPAGFFKANGKVPDAVLLRATMPEGLHTTVDQLDRRIEEKQREIRDEAKRKGQAFMGARRVLRQSPQSTPRSSAEHRNLNPRVASKDKEVRIEALQRLKQFLVDYKQALKRFMAGERDVVFPYGTYELRVRYSVMCNGP